VVGRIAVASLGRAARAALLSTASVDPDLDLAGGASSIAECLLRDAAEGHAIVPFWSAHQLTIALLTAERFGFRAVAERYEVVADDSFGGQIMQMVGAHFGLRMRTIHTRGNPRRFEDLGAWLRRPEPFFIAVDGGGVYGTVSTGIVRLAARLGSTVRPLAIRAKPAARCPGLVAEIPLPGAALALAVAAPIRVDRASPIAETAEALRCRLEAASAAAAALLGPGVGVEMPGGVDRRRSAG